MRPGPAAGFGEDRLIRGLHPRVAERMQLERLQEFDLTRLPSSDEEVYLFRCVARANPADERLVAMAQVRDLTPLREADGRLVVAARGRGRARRMPGRDPDVQVQRPAKRRFDTNRIVIYVWPPSRPVHGRGGPGRRSACCRPRRARAWRRSSSWPGARPETGELSDWP